MTVLIRFRERTGHAWLEVDYDGLEPPSALFDDLAMIGWSPPVLAPPPASSLDWNRADEARGTRYTVLPFRVTAARVDGPRGSGRSGAWTVGERPAYLGTLEGVLRRHAGDLVAHLPDDAQPIGAATDEEPVAATPPEQVPAGPPPAAVPVEEAAPAGHQRVRAVVDRAAGPSVVDHLRQRGMDPVVHATTRTKVIRFRGNAQESQVPAYDISVVVDPSQVVEARSLLAFDGNAQGVVVEPAEPEPSDATGAPPGGATPDDDASGSSLRLVS